MELKLTYEEVKHCVKRLHKQGLMIEQITEKLYYSIPLVMSDRNFVSHYETIKNMIEE